MGVVFWKLDLVILSICLLVLEFRSIASVKLYGVRGSEETSRMENNILLIHEGTEIYVTLFGEGFAQYKESSSFPIKFTSQIPKSNNTMKSCTHLSVSKAFPVTVESDSLAIAKIMLPLTENPYYICLLQPGENSYEHQGDNDYVIIRTVVKKSYLLPAWLQIIVLVLLLCFSGLFSGLNLGLMALDRTELKIIENHGSDLEKKYAKIIRPVRNKGNFLLCTLLLGNVLVNSTLTVLLDDLTGEGAIAVVGSTLGIVIFGEIIPQAICSRHGLAVGAKTLFLTKIFMVLTFPLSYPISKILDVILGEEIGSVYDRDKLKGLMNVTRGQAEIKEEEANIIVGALDLSRKTVKDIMTPIDDVFMIPFDATLNFDTISQIMDTGYSRIPVYEDERSNIVALLNIKDLAFVDPDDNLPLQIVCKYYKHPLSSVYDDTTLDRILEEFKKGKSHMSFVTSIVTEEERDNYYKIVGLVTLEDVIEEIIQCEIMDETDVITDNVHKAPRKLHTARKDFTLFTQEKVELPSQLAFATFQYLYTVVEPFRDGLISETILHRLLKKDVVESYKTTRSGVDAEVEMKKSPFYLYERNKASDSFIMILEGHVRVTIGTEDFTYDSGPFSCYGMRALNCINEALENEGKASVTGDRQLLKTLPSFYPDYSVQAATTLLYLRIKQPHYMAARRATLMEHARTKHVSDVTSFGSQQDVLTEELTKLTMQMPSPSGGEVEKNPPRLESANNSISTKDEDDGGVRLPLLSVADDRTKKPGNSHLRKSGSSELSPNQI